MAKTMTTIEEIQKHFRIDRVTVTVTNYLAAHTGYIAEYVCYKGSRIMYGVRRPQAKGYKVVGPIKEIAQWLEAELAGGDQ